MVIIKIVVPGTQTKKVQYLFFNSIYKKKKFYGNMGSKLNQSNDKIF